MFTGYINNVLYTLKRIDIFYIVYFRGGVMFGFSLFPMYFSDGSPSDGKAAVLTLKNQHEKKISDDIQFRKIEEQSKPKEQSRDNKK